MAAAVAVDRFGDEQREVGHRAADRRLDEAVHGLGPEDEPRVQACPDAAALIDAAESVARRGEAGGDALHLRSEPAHGEEHAPAHVAPEGLREHEARARDVDRQARRGGMVPELPSPFSLGKPRPPGPIPV